MKRHSSFRATVLLVCLAGAVWAVPSFTPKTYVPMSLQVVDEGPAVQEVPPPAGHAWYKFANHIHTTYSDGDATVAQCIQRSAANGADAVSILDHRTQGACSDPEFTIIDGCVPMCGEEWGWNGHLGMLNMDPGDPMAGWTLEQAIPEALARGATLVVHHPKTLGGDPWPYEDLHPGIRGIEVWNSPSYLFGSGAESTAWWNSLLSKGCVAFAIGGCDTHAASGNTLTPCNYVLAASPQPDDLQQGIEAGRIAVLADKDSPRCLIWCDANHDGTFEAPLGALVLATESGTLRFRIEVYSGQGRQLQIMNSEGLAHALTIGEGNPWRVDIETPAGPNTKDYLRAEIPDPETVLNPMDCITNPIYVNYTPDDDDSDGLSNSFEIQAGLERYSPDTDGDAVSDSYEVGYDGNSENYDPYNPVSNPSGTDMDATWNDSDYDGIKDSDELRFGTNPLDSTSYPELPFSRGPLFLLLLVFVITGSCFLTRIAPVSMKD